jgi:spermidine synthase
MARLLVGVGVNIDPELLEAINTHVKAKSQSERLRLCITEGFKVLKR